MKILLTGGAGYIGSHTCVELIRAGFEVVIVDDHSNSQPSVIQRMEKVCGTEIPHYCHNVTDSKAMERVFLEENIDAVVHFAGHKAVGESVKYPLRYYRNNLDTALTVLETMENFGVSRFVFSSSATVYGSPRTVPLAETAPTSCVNPYGRTKWMVEQILMDASHANPLLSVVNLRYFNPIGAHESGLLGDDPRGIPNNLMPFVSRVATGEIDRLAVFGGDYPTRDGTGIRDYIHVVDLAKGHVAAIRFTETFQGIETVNLGTGTGYSVLDLVKTFERVNGLEIPYQITERRLGDVAVCYADPTKAKDLLKWRAEKTLEDMCRDSWNHQLHTLAGFGNPSKEVMQDGVQTSPIELEIERVSLDSNL